MSLCHDRAEFSRSKSGQAAYKETQNATERVSYTVYSLAHFKFRDKLTANLFLTIVISSYIDIL